MDQDFGDRHTEGRHDLSAHSSVQSLGSGSVVALGDLCRGALWRTPATAPVAALEPEDLGVLRQALDEACAFLEDHGSLGPAKRRQVAVCIIRHARDGMRDPHRLAIKGIARAG